MRDMSVHGLLIYCSDYKCSHHVAISGDRWPDDVRLSDLEPPRARSNFQPISPRSISALPPKADHALVGDFDRLNQFFAKKRYRADAGGRDELPIYIAILARRVRTRSIWLRSVYKLLA
jgi:hypothetical protein